MWRIFRAFFCHLGDRQAHVVGAARDHHELRAADVEGAVADLPEVRREVVLGVGGDEAGAAGAPDGRAVAELGAGQVGHVLLRVGAAATADEVGVTEEQGARLAPLRGAPWGGASWRGRAHRTWPTRAVRGRPVVRIRRTSRG